MKVRTGPLRNRNFRLLLACNAILMTGTAVALVAIPFAVLAIGGSAADVGYVAAAVMVPALIFPLGGVVADVGYVAPRSWFPPSSSCWAGWSPTGCRAIRRWCRQCATGAGAGRPARGASDGV